MSNVTIDNNEITCFINGIPSKKLFEQLKNDKNKTIHMDKDNPNLNYINPEQYTNPKLMISFDFIIIKSTFIDSSGNSFKANLYFINDLINILKALKFDSPNYYDKNGNYSKLTEDTYYILFLYGPKATVKDIKNKEEEGNFIKEIISKNKFKETIKDYNDINFDEKVSLLKLNVNIKDFQDKIDLTNEKYENCEIRQQLLSDIFLFLKQKEVSDIKSHLFCFYGPYASGKSTLLMYINTFFKIKSVYLNLKKLKLSFLNSKFWKILFNDFLYLFIKEKNAKEAQYTKFITDFYDANKNQKYLHVIITNLIDILKNDDCFIILDQLNSSVESNIYDNLKKYLVSLKPDEIKIKLIICASINDKEMRKIHDSNIFELNIDFFFDFKYYEINGKIDLSDEKNKENEKINKIANDKFNNIFLYKQLIKKNINDTEKFINETKKYIRKNIEKFFESNQIENIIKLEETRNIIGEELYLEKAKEYSNYIPYKYFIIKKNIKTLALPSTYHIYYYFPLIQDIFEDIIIENTVRLFSGDIKDIEGKAVGTLLELNFKHYCIKERENLGINSIVKVQRIAQMNECISSEKIDNKKKILFIQTIENGPHYDFAYYDGTNDEDKKLCFIQVKKGYTNNKVYPYMLISDYNIIQKNLKKNFNIEPNSIYLCYIGLINDSLIKILKGEKINIKSINKNNKYLKSFVELYNFCNNNKIKIIFYHPLKKSFYKINSLGEQKQNSERFENCNLDYFIDNNIVSFKAKFQRHAHMELIELNEDNLVEKLRKNGEITINGKTLTLNEIKDKMNLISDEYEIQDIFYPKNVFKYLQKEVPFLVCLGFIENQNLFKAKYFFYQHDYFEIGNKPSIKKSKNLKIFNEVKLFVFVFLKNLKHLDDIQKYFKVAEE